MDTKNNQIRPSVKSIFDDRDPFSCSEFFDFVIVQHKEIFHIDIVHAFYIRSITIDSMPVFHEIVSEKIGQSDCAIDYDGYNKSILVF